MISFNEWKNNPSNMQRAKKVDLITLPPKISGTNCGNCKFIKDGFCTNKEVQMKVNSHQCCSLWDAEGAIRPWITENTKD